MPNGSSHAPQASDEFVNGRRLARMIDHTNLRPEATRDDIARLCREAREFGFAAVVVNPAYVELASSELAVSEVKLATVVGFPLGATLSSVKRFEASEALKLGASEIDMVLNVGALKSGQQELVRCMGKQVKPPVIKHPQIVCRGISRL